MRKLMFVLAAACFAPVVLARPAAEVYTSKAGGYSAKFPGTPKEETRKQPGPGGEVEVHLAVYASSNGTAYLTSHQENPGAPPADQQKAVLDAVVKGAAGGDGKLAENKDVAFGKDKLPARAYRVDRPKLSVRGLVVLKDGRVYQAIVTGSKDFVGGREATAFLDSFTLTK
jgi:hypothetical protein